MKLKNKIIMLFLLCLSFFTIDIYAVGNVYQTITVYNDCRAAHLEYRTTVRPYRSTEEALIKRNDVTYNKWLQILDETTGEINYDKNLNQEATMQTYSSEYLIFTKDKIAEYTPNTSSPFGYGIYNTNEVAAINEDSRSLIYNYLKRHELADVKDDLYQYTLSGNKLKVTHTLENLSDYMSNIYDVNESSITLKNGYYYNDSLTNVKYIKKLVPYQEARIMLLNDSYLGERTNNIYNEGTTLYVSDIYIDENTTENIINILKTERKDTVYSSAISKTLSWYGNPFYMITPTNFLVAKNNDLQEAQWSKDTLGKNNSGLLSALNLWDNELEIGTAASDKKVVIQHINVTKDLNGINQYSIIDIEDKSSISVDEEMKNKLEILKQVGLDWLNSRAKKETYYISNDITELSIKNLNTIDPTKNWYDEVGKLLAAKKFECIGYKKYTGSDAEENSKIHNLENLSSLSSETAITIDDETTVINIYYEAPKKDIVVQHVLLGKYALTGNGYGLDVNREKVTPDTINSTFATEYYYDVNELDEIIFSYNAGHNAKYLGYELNPTHNVTSISQYTIDNTTMNIPSYTVTKDSPTNSDGDIVIVFKYEAKASTTIPGTPEPIIKETPKPIIDGSLSIDSIHDIDTTCLDTYSVPGNAKNGQNDIYVGVKNIPNYILAGMHISEKAITGQTVKINITISFGPNSKTWTVEVPYEYSYYYVDQILMYKYDNTLIYNTKTGKDTTGERLFASADNTRKISPSKTNALVLYDINNNNIAKSDLSNWKNYVKTYYKTNYNVPNIVPQENSGEYIEQKLYYPSNAIGFYRNYTSAYYDGINISLQHETDKNNINEYITTSGIQSAYKAIALEGEANITINLLSNDMFNKINSGVGTELDDDDIREKIKATDVGIAEFNSLGETLNDALDAYKGICSDAGQGSTKCYNTIKSSCTSKTYQYDCIDVCTAGEDEEGNCKGPTTESCKTGYYACGDTEESGVCEKCGTVEGYYKTYEEAKEKLKEQKVIVEGLYSTEKYALQNFDEAKYIQDKYWNEYKNYTTEEIIKLIGLDVKFEYQSGNAKVGNKNLLTTELSTKELLLSGLDNSLTFKIKTDGQEMVANIGLQGSKNKLATLTQTLESKRPYLTDEQKMYYITGITDTTWIAENIGSGVYNNNTFKIPITTTNGKRVLAGLSTYVVDTENNVGKKAQGITDNMYYYDASDTNEEIFNVSTFDLYKSYGATAKNSNGVVNSQTFNIYTPLKVQTSLNLNEDIIDQTGKNSGTSVIQANSVFTINFYAPKESVYGYGTPNDFTSRYLNDASYYIKFDFDVDNVQYINAYGSVTSARSYASGTWIGPIYGDYIKAKARLNTDYGASITDTVGNYYVIAAAKNTTYRWTDLLKAVNNSLSDITNTKMLDELYNICGTEGAVGKKISYYADEAVEIDVVNRIYDFRVTDLKDVDWKETFRKNQEVEFINKHSGIAYYSGYSKWNTLDPTKYNEIVGRTEAEIGTSPTRILPLGPYKNTNTSYIKAPKIGYRFSFDVKVTGAPSNNKSVIINPKFYYISKNGNTFYNEYNGSGNGIYLFYKNSNGQYVRIGTNGDNYKITFTPNDGYRALVQATDKNLSKNNISIGSLTKLTLKFTETSTYSENDSAITYYGEYKLPNSTIAVKVENGKYDINKPLANGYIGVVFDIVANESGGINLYYGKNSYYKGSNSTAEPNSSQWDYEGYLGITKPGSLYNGATIKLEKGEWKMDNDTYNMVKGTVILYDLDSKASNDFN